MNLEADDPIEERVMEPGGDPAPAAVEAEAEDDDDGLVETTTIGSQKMVPVGDLIRYRKEARDARKQLAEQAERLTWADGVDAKLREMAPTLEAIRNNPKLVEQVQQGTRPSAPTTLQPQDDVEAQEWAEENGLITAEGGLDVARARRQLDKLDARAQKMAERTMGPMRQHTVNQVSDGHKQYAKTVTLKDGSKAASDESIEQAFAMLPPELTADKNVAALIPILAAGLDVFTGRRAVKAAGVDYPEPIHTESSAGRRGPVALTPDLARLLERTGVSEKDYRSTEKAYVPGRPMRLE